MVLELFRSEKWDKSEKLPFHCKDFPGTRKATWELLSLMNTIPNFPVTIERWYINPVHHFAIVRHSEKRITVYMDGNVLDPNEKLTD